MIGDNNANQAYSWSFLIVLAPRSDSILQIQEADRAMAIRECRNDTWTAWKAIQMSS